MADNEIRKNTSELQFTRLAAYRARSFTRVKQRRESLHLTALSYLLFHGNTYVAIR